jgi:hypothetical protein
MHVRSTQTEQEQGNRGARWRTLGQATSRHPHSMHTLAVPNSDYHVPDADDELDLRSVACFACPFDLCLPPLPC